jgi:hypothetical protein
MRIRKFFSLAAIVAVMVLRPAVSQAQDEILNGLSHRVDALEVVLTGVLRRLSEAEAALAAEKAARQAADALLQQQINSINAVTQEQLAAEVAARTAGDAALQASFSAEAAARAAADATLQTNINSEAAARQAADTTLQSNIDAEAAARAAADTGLRGNIDSEAAARHAADTMLQSNIDAEAAARDAADTTLQRNIDAISGGGGSVPENLLALAGYVSISTDPIQGLRGPHVIFTGVNVHIQNGIGASGDGIRYPGALNGVGNLIVGYNENHNIGLRSGSHNLVIGPGHGYESAGGFVAGSMNRVHGLFATITGGNMNRAGGVHSSVGGGSTNVATGTFSVVGGGSNNTASGSNATVSGGLLRSAVNGNNWVGGGLIQTN